jgi:hypothetical protein
MLHNVCVVLALQVCARSQSLLLQCAAPDAVVRLEQSRLSQHEQQRWFRDYHTHQTHNSLLQFLLHHLDTATNTATSLQAQVSAGHCRAS